MESIKYSLVIPVYKNEESLPRLIDAVIDLENQLDDRMEVVFVVDGSPDKSFEFLRLAIEKFKFPAQLLLHSRNFGSFPAIRTGLSVGRGEYFAVMAADLQEPPALLISFFSILAANKCDVTFGVRSERNDPFFSKLASKIFWGLYRRLVVPDMPKGGVDIFGCNRKFRDELLKLNESRSSLVALIFWLGFRREAVEYERLLRQEGKSSWTFSKKLDYMMDSIFAFTDFPIRLLMRIGILGCAFSIVLAITVLVGHLMGRISVPGYAATMIAVLFFGAVNLFGLGLVGTYAWRAYENSKSRPLAVTSIKLTNAI